MKPAHPVDLVAVLAARDERAARQAELAGRWAKPLASMTLVSPGPVKDSARHRYLMDLAFVRLERKLAAAGIEVLERRRGDSPAGPEALLAVACDASRLKSIALELEEGRPWGRLLDIDVLTPWEILRREDLGKAPRSCLCCDRPALECMRKRRHPVDVLVAEAERLMPFAEIGMTEEAAAAAIGEMAVDALSLEAVLEDKPGLVRPGNRGAHDDMDYPMLLCSAEALRECFTECAEAGLRFGRQGGAGGAIARDPGSEPEGLRNLLPILRPIGKAGEAAMYAATGGVNTHKGSIFSLGLLSAAAGALIGSDSRGDSPDSFGDAVCIAASRIASGIVSSELGREAEAAVGPTVGERLYLRHGVRGARGMAEDAFPLLRERMLPRLRMGRDSAVPTTQDSTGIRRSLWLDALLESMAVLDDTCVLGRGGLEGLRCIERGAREALDSGGAGTAAGASLIRELDVECCDRWLSPGGSADLVSAALFLDALERMPVRVF